MLLRSEGEVRQVSGGFIGPSVSFSQNLCASSQEVSSDEVMLIQDSLPEVCMIQNPVIPLYPEVRKPHQELSHYFINLAVWNINQVPVYFLTVTMPTAQGCRVFRVLVRTGSDIIRELLREPLNYSKGSLLKTFP